MRLVPPTEEQFAIPLSEDQMDRWIGLLQEIFLRSTALLLLGLIAYPWIFASKDRPVHFIDMLVTITPYVLLIAIGGVFYDRYRKASKTKSTEITNKQPVRIKKRDVRLIVLGTVLISLSVFSISKGFLLFRRDLSFVSPQLLTGVAVSLGAAGIVVLSYSILNILDTYRQNK